eukprot:9888316-Lingulodinium_polyedra.AAC.1
MILRCLPPLGPSNLPKTEQKRAAQLLGLVGPRGTRGMAAQRVRRTAAIVALPNLKAWSTLK